MLSRKNSGQHHKIDSAFGFFCHIYEESDIFSDNVVLNSNNHHNTKWPKVTLEHVIQTLPTRYLWMWLTYPKSASELWPTWLSVMTVYHWQCQLSLYCKPFVHATCPSQSLGFFTSGRLLIVAVTWLCFKVAFLASTHFWASGDHRVASSPYIPKSKLKSLMPEFQLIRKSRRPWSLKKIGLQRLFFHSKSISDFEITEHIGNHNSFQPNSNMIL